MESGTVAKDGEVSGEGNRDRGDIGYHNSGRLGNGPHI